MATQLFKDGTSIWVETHQVNSHIAIGYSPNDPAVKIIHPHTILPAGMGLDKMPQKEAEKAILERMGIRQPEPIAVIAPAPPEPRVKRAYNRKAK